METRKSVLEMTAPEAKKFFLKSSSYVNIRAILILLGRTRMKFGRRFEGKYATNKEIDHCWEWF